MNRIERVKKRIDSTDAMDNHYLVSNNDVRHLIAEIDQQAKQIEWLIQIDGDREADFYLHANSLKNKVKELDSTRSSLELAVQALEDIKYQIQQSDHPAGLGILTELNSTLEEIKRLGEGVNK